MKSVPPKNMDARDDDMELYLALRNLYLEDVEYAACPDIDEPQGAWLAESLRA